MLVRDGASKVCILGASTIFDAGHVGHVAWNDREQCHHEEGLGEHWKYFTRIFQLCEPGMMNIVGTNEGLANTGSSSPVSSYVSPVIVGCDAAILLPVEVFVLAATLLLMMVSRGIAAMFFALGVFVAATWSFASIAALSVFFAGMPRFQFASDAGAFRAFVLWRLGFVRAQPMNCSSSSTEDPWARLREEVSVEMSSEAEASLGAAKVPEFEGSASDQFDTMLESDGVGEFQGSVSDQLDTVLRSDGAGEFEGTVSDQLDTVLESEGAGGDPWARYVPGKYEIGMIERYEPQAFCIEAVATAHGWDPHQLMYFVFEHGPKEGMAACEMYYSILGKLNGSEDVTFSGGVIQEVPQRFRPGPTKKMRLLVKGQGGGCR